MTKSVGGNRNKYRNYSNQYANAHNPINPVIDGYFPKHKTYKEMAIARVNRTLCVILLLFILSVIFASFFLNRYLFFKRIPAFGGDFL